MLSYTDEETYRDAGGVKGFEYSPWYGAFAPAKVPTLVLARLHAALNTAIGDPDVRQKLGQQGLEVQELTRQQFVELVQTETAKWGRLIKTLGIRGAEQLLPALSSQRHEAPPLHSRLNATSPVVRASTPNSPRGPMTHRDLDQRPQALPTINKWVLEIEL